LVGEELRLDASGSVDGDSYRWAFGDGEIETATESNTVHTWTAPGHYTVVLVVEDVHGRRASDSLRVDVVWPPAEVAPQRAALLAAPVDGHRLFVAMPDFSSVAVVDTVSREVVDHLSVCQEPIALAHGSTSARLAVSCRRGGAVQVWETDGLTLQVDIDDLPHGALPAGAVFGPSDASVYVLTSGDGVLREFSLDSGAELSWELTGLTDPSGLATVAGGILVSRKRSPDSGAAWWRIEPGGTEVSGHFELAPDPGPDSDTTNRGVPSYLVRLTPSPDGRRVVFPSLQANTERGLFRDGRPLTHETTARAILSQASLLDGTLGVEGERKIFDDRDMASDAVFSPWGDWLYVGMSGAEIVDVLDAYSLESVGSFQGLGHGVDGLWVSPDGAELWVLASLSRQLVVLSLEPGEGELARIDLRPGGVETLSPDVLLGKQVFHSSADPRMSLDDYLSCASCHLDGTQDGRVWDFTDRGEGLRNTLSLAGRSGTNHGPLHWSGNFDEVQDFEGDIRGAMAGAGFLSDEDWVATADPLGESKAGRSAELDGLAAYLETLTEVLPSPYRQTGGSMTDDALLGEALFLDPFLGCVLCHPPPEYTDSTWQSDGTPLLHDVGTLGPGSGGRLGGELTGIDTPSLRGLWSTAPYLHDGSAGTLAEVLSERNTSDLHGVTSELSGAQIVQLESFLLQLE